MDEKTKEEMIGILQEVISGFSYDYSGENGNIEEAWIQVMCRLATKEHNYNEGKYTKEQLDEFEKYMENKGIIEGYTKYSSISSQARKHANAKLAECLEQGTLNYELCSEIKKYFNTELLKRRNDANIDYFRDLVEQDSLSYDEYIEKARAQVEKITKITMDQYNTRFAQILGAYLSKVPMAPLQASKDGYPYKYMPYLKEQTAGLHSEYGDFIDRKDDVGSQESLDEKIQYLFGRSKMIGALHDCACNIKPLEQFDSLKQAKEKRKQNEVLVKDTRKILSSIVSEYEKAISKLHKKAKKEAKLTLKEQKAADKVKKAEEKAERSAEKAEKKRIKKEEKAAKKEQRLLPEARLGWHDQAKYTEELKADGSGYLSYEQQVKNAVVKELGVSESIVNNPVVGNAIYKYLNEAGISIERIGEKMANGEFTVQTIGNGCSFRSKYQRRSLDVVMGKDGIVVEEGYEQYGGSVYTGENKDGIPIMKPGEYTYHRRTMKYDSNTCMEMSRKNAEYSVTDNHQVGKIKSSVEYVRDNNYLEYARDNVTGTVIDLSDGPGDIASLDDVELDDNMRKEMSMRKQSNIQMLVAKKRSEEAVRKVECYSAGKKYRPLTDEELFKSARDEIKESMLRAKIEGSKYKESLLKCPQFSNIIAEKDERF